MKRTVPRLEGAARTVAKGELVGLPVEVVESPDAGIVGLTGRVVDETLRTLTIRRSDGREMQLAKAACTFRFQSEQGAVDVPGRAIEFRPEDRTKKVK